MEKRGLFLMLLFGSVIGGFCTGHHHQKKPVINTGTQVWCVAKPHADPAVLQKGLNFACGEGGADCTPIQPNSACYNPNTVIAHASYAFNSYYQKKGRNFWNCYFQNAALLVVTDPSYGSCNYPAV